MIAACAAGLLRARALPSRCSARRLAGAAVRHASDVVLYRVFLLDGTTAGQLRRVRARGRRVVFSMPLGELRRRAAAAARQLPGDRRSTGRGPTRMRRRRARSTSRRRAAKRILALLSDAVAAALNQIASPRIRRSGWRWPTERAQTLSDWPASNFGYRAADVAQLDGAARRSRLGAAGRGRAVAVRSEPRRERRRRRRRCRCCRRRRSARASSRRSRCAARRRMPTAARVAPARDHRGARRAGARRRLGGGAARPRQRRARDLDEGSTSRYTSLSARTLQAADERLRRADVAGRASR